MSDQDRISPYNTNKISTNKAFQRTMDKILFCVQDIHISVNDVIIYGKTTAQLAQRAHMIF